VKTLKEQAGKLTYSLITETVPARAPHIVRHPAPVRPNFTAERKQRAGALDFADLGGVRGPLSSIATRKLAHS